MRCWTFDSWARLAVGLLVLACLFVPLTGVGQTPSPGTVVGKVTDTDGKPLAYANILIVGTSWGAFSLEDGSYKVPNIPPGAYTVAVSIIGYEDQKVDNVTLSPNGTVTVNFKIKARPVGSLQEVEIVARREVIQKRRTDISHHIETKDVASLPVNELTDVLGLKAGVIARADGLHFRGGRSGEVQYQVDGVVVRDPLVGRSASLATLAVENVEQIMGGLDAQYGNAQSGVVNYKTKEGTDQFEGEIYYLTDDYGQPDNTYDNLDKVFLGVGGPSPIKNLTYYISGEGTFADDYPATNRRRNHRRILNFISVGDRKSNTVRLQGKLAFRPRSDQKATFEVLRSRSLLRHYHHGGRVAAPRPLGSDPGRLDLPVLQRGRAHADLHRQLHPDEVHLEPHHRRGHLLYHQAQPELLLFRLPGAGEGAVGVRREPPGQLLQLHRP